MRLSIEPFALDLATPLETAKGTIEQREGFVVIAEEDGQVGLGEATPLPGWTESIADCRKALEGAVEEIERTSVKALQIFDRTPAARHGVSLALADLGARREGVPLYLYLGGESRVVRVPVNATIGDGPARETAEQAGVAVGEGYESIKIKVGAREVAADVDRLARVREAVGSEVEIRADANGVWDPTEVRRPLHEFGVLDVSYVEQPLPPGDLAGHASLRGEAVDIALDESLIRYPVERILKRGAADVLVLKPMVLGGIDRALDAAQRARAAGVDVVVTTTVDAVIARTAAVHVAASLPKMRPCGLATAKLLADDQAPDPAPVQDGHVRVPQDDGLGIDVSEVTL